MKSITLYLTEESRALGYISSGLGGLVGLGGLTGQYQSKKQEAAQRELDRREGKLDMYKTDKFGRHIGHAVIGGIPVVGSISSIIAAKKRYDLADKIHDDDIVQRLKKESKK